MHQLAFVRRRHQHKARQAAEIGDIETTGMGGAVGANRAGAVHGEAHREALDGDVLAPDGILPGLTLGVVLSGHEDEAQDAEDVEDRENLAEH